MDKEDDGLNGVNKMFEALGITRTAKRYGLVMTDDDDDEHQLAKIMVMFHCCMTLLCGHLAIGRDRVLLKSEARENIKQFMASQPKTLPDEAKQVAQAACDGYEEMILHAEKQGATHRTQIMRHDPSRDTTAEFSVARVTRAICAGICSQLSDAQVRKIHCDQEPAEYQLKAVTSLLGTCYAYNVDDGAKDVFQFHAKQQILQLAGELYSQRNLKDA